MLLRIVFHLVLVSFSVTQKGPEPFDPVDLPREVPGCDVIECVNGGCGQFEQCLLEAQMMGCNPQLITYSASDKYERCLFGRDGFCSLAPLGGCYRTHLQEHTKTPLPPALSTSPDTLAAFIDVLLEDAAGSTNFLTRCRVPVSAVYQMTKCVLKNSGQILQNCESVMPIATKRYFSRPNRRVTLVSGVESLTRSLSNYTNVCSNFGQWTRWFNDFHPSTTNGSDFETPSNPCGPGGGSPTAVDCDIDDAYGQLCAQEQTCTNQQIFTCLGPARSSANRGGGGGLVCRAEDQDESITGDLCPCCDYRVRYLCPVQDIITISPNYGPASGNTSVTLVGAALRSFPLVSIGAQACSIQERTQFRIVCTTPPVNLGQQKERIVNVFLAVQSSRINTNSTFTYKADANVDKVYNLDTLVSGGTEVTIEGTNFLSITLPRMTITVLYKDNGKLLTWVYESTCRIASDTIIKCPVPALINPWEFTNNTRPTPTPLNPPDNTLQAAALMSDLEDEEVQYTGYMRDFLRVTGRSSPRRRTRRATCGKGSGATPINDDDQLTYQVDIDLDGQAVSGNYNLDVYVDPNIERFEEAPNCRIFRNWLLASDTEMEIKGSRLNDGLDCSEYNVRVGDAVCSVQDLFSNRIICHPPDSKPYPGAGDVQGRIGVEVLIGTGNLRYAVGCLDYEEQLLDNPYGRYGLIAGLSALALIILLITICCCCRYRRKQRDN